MIKVSVIVPAYNVKFLLLRALDSVPHRPDLEILVCDDASTDGTWDALCEYGEQHSDLNLLLFRNETNQGVGFTRNVLLDKCSGEYVYGLDADDYLYTDNFEKAIAELDGTDMVYVSAKSNNGAEWIATNANKRDYGAMWLKFIRREFIGSTRVPSIRWAEDKAFNAELLSKNPTEKWVNLVVYHYNHPRAGSLCYMQNYGGNMGKELPITGLKNVFYFADINAIGGVETMFYTLARKYGADYDITILYRTGDPKQIDRLRQFVRVIQYRGQFIQCEKAFFNFDTSPIDTIEANEYSVILHSDYQARKITVPYHKKITRWIGVSENVTNTARAQSGYNVETCYNPIIVDKPRKVLRLISATRLTAEKGKNRMKILADKLTEAGIPFIWTVFTNDNVPINNPNVIYMKPCLTVTDYIADADYLVQLSDTEGYSYTILEALCLGVPVITTPCPVYKEMGLNEKNSFILPFDMSEIPVEKIYKGLKKGFKYTPHEDRWPELLAPGKSDYDERAEKELVTIRVTRIYMDLELDNRVMMIGETLQVRRARAELLIGRGFAEYTDGQTTTV